MPKIKITKKRTKSLVLKRKKRTIKKKKTTGSKLVGIITHYFPKVSAAAVKLKACLSLGDIIQIKGHTTNFIQTVNSLQLNRQPIKKGKKGQEIGLLVNSRVRKKDLVYKLANPQID
ncbi:MAG: hypothetical protein N2Z79_05335 [Candidatus Omnitrophica bacterium]|nr:hypothetical protein [Candidatus Omnitrophota bacterium]